MCAIFSYSSARPMVCNFSRFPHLLLSMTLSTENERIVQVIGEMRRDVYQVLCLAVMEPTMSPALFHDTVFSSFTSRWGEVPPEPTPRRPTASVGTQCDAPGSHVSVPAPEIPRPIRCASNNFPTGHRCRLQAFYPFTLCVVHFRFATQHAFLPNGGADRPYCPHPGDRWASVRGR